MENIEFDILGYYEPGFLHLRINTEYDIQDLNKLLRERPDLFSTFFHEYIHFLQDVSSTYGLFSAGFYVDYIKDINWEIRHDGKPEFYVPVKPTNINNVAANLELSAIYRGSTDGSSSVKYDRYTEEIMSVKDKSGRVVRPTKYIVHYYDLISRQSKRLHFGYACLKEYVAHVLQSKFIPETEHPDIPYHIAALIVQKEFPHFGDDPILIAALCDCALMSFHPAQVFFNTLKRMKEFNFVPQTTKSVYDFAYNDLEFKGQDKTENFESLFKGIHAYADGQFADALQSDIFQPNYAWINHILSSAMKLRLENVDFITKLVEGPGKLSTTFFEIMNLLGTPFFTNNKEIGRFIPPANLESSAIQPYQLLVFKQALLTFAGQRKCSLYGFCKTRPDKDITNSHCITSPWLRAKEEELCPFGQIWKTWGLINEVPVGR